MGDSNLFGDGKGGPGVGPNLLDPLDLRKSGATDAAQQAGQLQYDAAMAGVGELRRQFDTTTGNLQPFVQAGLSQLPGALQASTAGGLDARLKQIMGGEAFGSLVAERGKVVNNQLSQGGLTRSGAALREAARIPTDVALALESELFGRQSNLLGSGQNAAAGLGALGSQNASGIAGLLGRGGDALAQSAVAQGQIATGRTQNAVGIASLFFSDPRLKENMEPIGKIGPLTLYEWDWKEEARGIMGCSMNLGFDADEVAKHFPQHIVEFAGFKAIDYAALTDELKERIHAAN
jgi:hypothetical protein